jgi:GNAT superfamily N-acetyltransferase
LEIKDLKTNHKSSLDFSVEKQFPVDLANYRNVYKEVGGPWDWANRLVISEKELDRILSNPKNEIYYCYYKGEFAGYFELDTHTHDFELVYFGLSPKFIGKGLGRQMMQRVIKKAEEHNAARLWLHTCELDSPQALAFYLKSGFLVYKETVEDQTIIILSSKTEDGRLKTKDGRLSKKPLQ